MSGADRFAFAEKMLLAAIRRKDSIRKLMVWARYLINAAIELGDEERAKKKAPR